VIERAGSAPLAAAGPIRPACAHGTAAQSGTERPDLITTTAIEAITWW
jgi:hypothetical protein